MSDRQSDLTERQLEICASLMLRNLDLTAVAAYFKVEPHRDDIFAALVSRQKANSRAEAIGMVGKAFPPMTKTLWSNLARWVDSYETSERERLTPGTLRKDFPLPVVAPLKPLGVAA
jgi:hypothetical protein